MNNVLANPADNTPGIFKISFVPVLDAISIPFPVAGTIVDPIVLKTGKLWYEMNLTVDANTLSVDNNNGSNGSNHANIVSGFIAGDSPHLVSTLAEMAQYEDFLVIAEDPNGLQRLIGSIDQPARFTYKLGYNGRRGYSVSFAAANSAPSYFYQSPFVAYPDELLVSPSLINLDAYLAAYLADYSAHLDDYLKRDGSKSLKGLLEVSLGAGLLWQSGSDHVKLNANASANLLRIDVTSDDHINYVNFSDVGLESYNEAYYFFASANGLMFANSTHKATLKADLLAADTDYQMPASAGTLALLSDIDTLLTNYIKRDGTSAETTGNILIGDGLGFKTKNFTFDATGSNDSLYVGSIDAYKFIQMYASNDLILRSTVAGNIHQLRLNSAGFSLYANAGEMEIASLGNNIQAFVDNGFFGIAALNGLLLKTNGNAFDAVFKSDNITGTQTFQVPNKSGTLALDSDLEDMSAFATAMAIAL